MEDDGKLSSDCNLGFAEPASLRKPDAPSFEPDTHALGRVVEENERPSAHRSVSRLSRQDIAVGLTLTGSEGGGEEAVYHFAEASRLQPESWAIWRQAAQKDANGLATSAEFWARVDALGDSPYHRPVDMKGLR